MLTPEEAQEILECFADADLSLIDRVVYFGGWQTYEEHGGILVFRGIDGSIQRAEYGYCVMVSREDNENKFFLTELTADEAVDEILHMLEASAEYSSHY